MGEIVVEHKGDMLFESTVRGHTVKIDVPESMGGKNRAMLPPELFILSLGSCVGAFVANYCKNANIDIDDLKIVVSFDKIENPARIDNIRVNIKLKDKNIEKRKKAILRVAESCILHNTLCSDTKIEINIAD